MKKETMSRTDILRTAIKIEEALKKKQTREGLLLVRKIIKEI
jgi:hypothetical protein